MQMSNYQRFIKCPIVDLKNTKKKDSNINYWMTFPHINAKQNALYAK